MISFELLDQDAIGFAHHVVVLVDALSHPDDGCPLMTSPAATGGTTAIAVVFTPSKGQSKK